MEGRTGVLLVLLFSVLIVYGKSILIGFLLWYYPLPALKNSSIKDGDAGFVKYSFESVSNFAGNFNITTSTYYPRTVSGLQGVVKSSRENGVRIQVVGTRHSWNNLILPQTGDPVNLVSLIDPAAADHLNLFRPEFEGWLDNHGELSSVIGYETRLDGGKEVCIVEVGAGTLFLQLLIWAQKTGYFLKNSVAPSRLTLGGAILTQSHGSGLGEPALPVHVVGLKYIDVSGEVVELSNEEDIDVYISSLGLLGPAVSFKIRLEKVGLAEVEKTISTSLEKWLPRLPAVVPQSVVVRLLRSDYQQFILIKMGLEDKSLLQTIKWSPAKPPIKSRPLSEDQASAHDDILLGLVNAVFRKIAATVPGFRDPLTYILRLVIEQVTAAMFVPDSHTTKAEDHLDTIHPAYVASAYKPFRVFEYCFPVYKDADNYDFSLVQRAVWDALDLSSELRLGPYTDGIDDHFDVRFVKPSPLALSPYPSEAGVGFWACMCVGTSQWTPEHHRLRLIREITDKWKSYSHKGRPVTPRPHWAKDMPPGELDYLRRVYAPSIERLRPKLEAMAERGGSNLHKTLAIFGNKMTKALFS